MASPALLAIFGLSAVAILPASFSHSDPGAGSSDTCGAKISQLEQEVEAAVGSSRLIHFIENNATLYQSLHQKYTLYWISTKYDWKTDVGSCSASLGGITASFQMSNDTVPFIGMAHFTIDPSMTKIISLHVDVPGSPSPFK